MIDLLDTDPSAAEHSEAAYQTWLQALTDEALSRSKEHFEIPDVMDRCEALIPPAGSAAAAYYTGPSEDFTRPGRTWYPTLGRTMFPRWGDVTTCYHESVPGHHLQIAYAKVQAGVAQPDPAQQLHPRPWRRAGRCTPSSCATSSAGSRIPTTASDSSAARYCAPFG